MAEETKTVVTERAEMHSERQLNSVTVVSMPPWKIALVRATRCYIQSFAGLLLAIGTGTVASLGMKITRSDVLHTVASCAILAAFAAAASLLQNTVELWFGVDATNPKMRA